MESTDMKTCPYCAEMIKAEAVKCRYCGSNLDRSYNRSDSAENWIRVAEGKRIAGVCTGIAHELNAPGLVLPIRIFFIITAFLSGFGLVLYALLWILMPTQKQFTPPVTSRNTPNNQAYKTGVLTVPSSSTAPQKQVSNRNSGGKTALIGLILVAIGAVLVMSRLGMGWDLPHGFTHFHMPAMPFIPSFRGVDMFPFPLIAFIAGLVMFAVLVGVLRFFKVVLGCGLIAVSLLFLLVLVPFAPAVLNVPLLIMAGIPILILVGFILLIVGGIRLILG